MSAFRERDGYRERDRMGGYRDDSYRGRDRSPPPYRGGYRDDYRGRGGRGRDYDERDYYTPDDRQGRDGYRRERERSPPKDKMLSFKNFMAMQTDDLQPKEAEVMYKEYLIRQLGNAKNVWFEEHHDKDEMKNRYHPTHIEETLKKRQQEARQSASAFVPFGGAAGGEASDAEMTPAGEGKDQGAVVKFPKAAWSAEQTDRDVAILFKLIGKMDQEKGISKNPLFEDGDPSSKSGDEKNQVLEKMLEYAWKVHGVDYYAGKEVAFFEFDQRKEGTHTRRGPRPDAEASGAMEEGDSEEEKQFFKNLEIKWELRVIEGDQATKLIGKDKIEEDIEDHVKTQVKCIDDTKFMCVICTKLFKGKDFVVKHILNKHDQIIQDIRCQKVHQKYKDNFLSDRTFTDHEKEYQDLKASMDQAGASGRGVDRPLAPEPEPPRPVRRYNDLDQPKVGKREVLDYGDLDDI